MINRAKHGLCGPASELVAVALDLGRHDGATLGVELGPPAGGYLRVEQKNSSNNASKTEKIVVVINGAPLGRTP